MRFLMRIVSRARVRDAKGFSEVPGLSSLPLVETCMSSADAVEGSIMETINANILHVRSRKVIINSFSIGTVVKSTKV